MAETAQDVVPNGGGYPLEHVGVVRHGGFSPPVPHGDSDESVSIAQLAAALAKAQGAMEAAKKDSTNPHFRSSYADLASIWAACRAPLSANGLAILQRVRTEDGGVTLVTMLVHASGEWVRDTLHFPVSQPTPQAYGSAITYARRYALAALVGVAADEDDDGNAASGHGQFQQRYEPQSKKKSEAPPPKSKIQGKDSTPWAAQSEQDRNRANAIWVKAKAHMDAPAFAKWSAGHLGAEKPSAQWTHDDMSILESAIQELELDSVVKP